MDIRQFNKLYDDVRYPSNEEPMLDYNIGVTSLPHGYQYGGGTIGYSNGGLAPITAGMPIAPGYVNGGRVGYGFGGMITKMLDDPKLKDAISKLPPETAQAISISSDGGGLGGLIKKMTGSIFKMVSPVVTGAVTPNVIPTTPTEVIPPANISLTQPLGRAGFFNNEIVDILKRLGYSFARGGYVSKGEPVNTDLTRTIPPVRGPNPQGVESLFKKRYS